MQQATKQENKKKARRQEQKIMAIYYKNMDEKKLMVDWAQWP